MTDGGFSFSGTNGGAVYGTFQRVQSSKSSAGNMRDILFFSFVRGFELRRGKRSVWFDSLLTRALSVAGRRRGFGYARTEPNNVSSCVRSRWLQFMFRL